MCARMRIRGCKTCIVADAKLTSPTRNNSDVLNDGDDAQPELPSRTGQSSALRGWRFAPSSDDCCPRARRPDWPNRPDTKVRLRNSRQRRPMDLRHCRVRNPAACRGLPAAGLKPRSILPQPIPTRDYDDACADGWVLRWGPSMRARKPKRQGFAGVRGPDRQTPSRRAAGTGSSRERRPRYAPLFSIICR